MDDTYIFYKYAKNIAEGNGYVFNLGDKVNATTSPLYTLALAFIYWVLNPIINIDFTVVGNLVSIVSIIWIFYSIKKLLNNNIQFYFFSMIFLAMPLLKFGFGMETYLNLAIIFYAIYLYSNEKYLLSSFYIGLSVLARFDSVLFAGIIFLHYIYKKRKLPPPKTMAGFLIVILPWFIFSKFYFNSFFPTTIAAKLSQNKLGIFGDGLIFFTNSISVIPGKHSTVFLIISMVMLSVFYLYRTKKLASFSAGINLSLIWLIVLFITYGFIINAPPYQWYYIPFVLAASLLFSFTLPQIVINYRLQNIILFCFFVIALVSPIKNYLEGYNPKYNNLTKAVGWLNANAKEGDLLAVDEIGILGYNYKKGKLVDALGLINPEISNHLKVKDFNWFLNHFKPEYIIHEYPNMQKHLRGDPQYFSINYKVINIYENRREKIAIFKRKVY